VSKESHDSISLKSKKMNVEELGKEIANLKNKNKNKDINKDDINNDDNDHDDQILWNSIAKNYEMILGAQIANSFILLMALSKSTKPLSTTQISEIVTKKSKGEVFKLSSTLKDSLEYRLKRDGYVESTELKNKSLYSITAKGRKLLKGWIAFLSAYS